MIAFRLTILLAAVTTASVAQPVVSVRIGMDGNVVSGISEWQARDRALLNARGVAVVETDSFPSFLSLQADVGLQLSTARRLIAHAGFGSTSGRLDYSDFSGRARADRRAQRLFAGVTGEHVLGRAGPLALWASVSARVSRVSVEYDREIVLGDEVVESNSDTRVGWPASVEPALSAEVSVGPAAFVRIQGGWEYSFGGSLSGIPGNADVSASWEGGRVGVSGGVRF